MGRVSGDHLKAPGFPKGPAGPLAVPRASELAAGFSVPFCPVKKERSRKPEADPCGPQHIQNKESNPEDVKATRDIVGKIKPRGGGKPPPYRARERGRSTVRSRQDKIALNGQGICGHPPRPILPVLCPGKEKFSLLYYNRVLFCAPFCGILYVVFLRPAFCGPGAIFNRKWGVS